MDFQTAVKTCLTKKYASYSGRASRSEYWWFVLAYVIGAVVLSVLGIGILNMIYLLALIIPLTAVGFRRLQDTGKPGWYIFIPAGLGLITSFMMPEMPVVEGDQVMHMPDMGSMGFMALLGLVQLVLAVLFIWWLTRPSHPADNEYGPMPTA